LAAVVKDASVLTYAAEGSQWFGTGGAGTNAESIGMNKAVGDEITETCTPSFHPRPTDLDDPPISIRNL
jgi:hypothetical protein